MGLSRLAVVAVALLPATAAIAQSVSSDAAKALLFPAEGVLVTVFNLPMLGDQDKLVLGEIAKQQKYYGAVALSPDEGLMAEPTLAAANYHAIPPAEAAALAACNKVRRPNSAPCVIAAHIQPAGYAPRPVQLSVDATTGFAKSWDNVRPQALAISPATGKWAIARGQGAADLAVSDCNRAAGAQDCSVAIAD